MAAAAAAAAAAGDGDLFRICGQIVRRYNSRMAAAAAVATAAGGGDLSESQEKVQNVHSRS